MAACFPQQATEELTPDSTGENGDPNVPEIEEPPTATLRIQESSQVSGVGSYCWRAPGADVAVCADALGIPTPDVPIQVDSPFTASFVFPIAETPENLFLTAIPVSAADEMEVTEPGMRLWEPGSGQGFDLPRSSPSEIELNLEPGLHVLSVFANWEDLGDVTYGFLVEVTGSATGGSGAFPILETEVTAVVTVADEVTFYSGPGDNFEPVATVFGGLLWPVTGVSEDGGWWRLQCTDDAGNPIAECWVSASPSVTGTAEELFPEFPTRPTDVTEVVALPAVGLNIRGGPGIEYDVVGFLPGNETIAVTGVSEDGDWWRVVCEDGSVGSCWLTADPNLSEPAGG